MASNARLSDTCRRQEWAGCTTGCGRGGSLAWTLQSKPGGDPGVRRVRSVRRPVVGRLASGGPLPISVSSPANWSLRVSPSRFQGTQSGGRHWTERQERRTSEGVGPKEPAGRSLRPRSQPPAPAWGTHTAAWRGRCVRLAASRRAPPPFADHAPAAGHAPSPPPRRPASPLMRRAWPMGARGGAGRGGGLGARRDRASVGPRRRRQELVPAPPRAPLGSGAAPGGGEPGEGRRAAGPAGRAHGLGTPPPAAPPAWGNFTPSRVSVPAARRPPGPRRPRLRDR